MVFHQIFILIERWFLQFSEKLEFIILGTKKNGNIWPEKNDYPQLMCGLGLESKAMDMMGRGKEEPKI